MTKVIAELVYLLYTKMVEWLETDISVVQDHIGMGDCAH